MNLLIKLLLTAVAVVILAYFLPGVTLEGNSYDVDITLITNLLDTNYSVHEVAGTGSEFVTIYDSTTTITIEEIE